MDAAYRHGLELSRREHGRPSTTIALQQSPINDWTDDHLFGDGVSITVYRRIPEYAAAGYSSDDELAAFGAGWIDGAAQYPGMMRKAIEGDDYQSELN
jgi:hypothetical protein